MLSRKASSARVACVRVRLASDAILPTKSFLFTESSRCPRLISNPESGVNNGRITIRAEWQFQYQLFYTAVSEGHHNFMTQSTVQIIAGVLCVLLIAVIFLRRKGKKGKAEDDF